MNKTQLEGKWHQLKGEIKTNWGNLTDDQIDQTEGNLEKLQGQIMETYGIQIQQAQDEIAKFMKRHDLD